MNDSARAARLMSSRTGTENSVTLCGRSTKRSARSLPRSRKTDALYAPFALPAARSTSEPSCRGGGARRCAEEVAVIGAPSVSQGVCARRIGRRHPARRDTARGSERRHGQNDTTPSSASSSSSVPVPVDPLLLPLPRPASFPIWSPPRRDRSASPSTPFPCDSIESPRPDRGRAR